MCVCPHEITFNPVVNCLVRAGGWVGEEEGKEVSEALLPLLSSPPPPFLSPFNFGNVRISRRSNSYTSPHFSYFSSAGNQLPQALHFPGGRQKEQAGQKRLKWFFQVPPHVLILFLFPSPSEIVLNSSIMGLCVRKTQQIRLQGYPAAQNTWSWHPILDKLHRHNLLLRGWAHMPKQFKTSCICDQVKTNNALLSEKKKDMLLNNNNKKADSLCCVNGYI